MKLFYSPAACSLGIHVLLEEIGAPFEAVRTVLSEGAHKTPEYLAINPKAKVPVIIRDNGRVLTELPAIAQYLARIHPEANLMPSDPDLAADALEILEYIVATVHMQGFTRWARPGNFAPNEADFPAVKARGLEIYQDGLKLLDGRLAGREFAVGAHFTVADAALIFVENWAGRAGVTLPENLSAHFARMKARPAVQRAFATEGLPL
jgi:glutathione S-transferase